MKTINITLTAEVAAQLDLLLKGPYLRKYLCLNIEPSLEEVCEIFLTSEINVAYQKLIDSPVEVIRYADALGVLHDSVSLANNSNQQLLQALLNPK